MKVLDLKFIIRFESHIFLSISNKKRNTKLNKPSITAIYKRLDEVVQVLSGGNDFFYTFT